MNYRRASTIELILLSAAAYAAIPVALSEMDPQLVSSFPVVLIVLKVAIALPVAVSAWGRSRFLASLKDRNILLLSSIQAFFFVLSLLLFAMSLASLDTPVAIVITETWPIPSAIAMGYLMRDQLSRLEGSDYLWGSIAFLGVVLVLDLPSKLDGVETSTWIGALLALASAVTMGLSVAFKARAVKLMRERHHIGPVLSYFLLQFFFLPALPLFAIYFAVFPGAEPAIDVPAGSLWDSWPWVLVIVALNFTSSVLYSFATLKLKRASDGFVWFFTPAFSLLLFSLWTGEALKGHELIGLTFILSSNLLLTIAADTTRAFKSLVLTVLGAGSWCYFVDPFFVQNEYYFDALSILSIFFVVILVEGLGQVSRQSDEEQRLLIELNHALADKDAHLADAFVHLCKGQSPVLFKRRYHLLRRALIAGGHRHIALDLDRLAHARNRTLRLGKHVSLAACLVATASIGLLARPETWLAEMFITVYLPSMVFSFFILIEGQLDQERSLFRHLTTPGGDHVIRVLAQRSPRDSVIWSLILSAFIIVTYAYALTLAPA
ncbi:hypothetical protein MUY21_08795 [Aliiroseovarius sp. S2029]|uniref:hypothetical protein n=1 Tax=Aliiroseovarius sp. S2029 TaxID=2936988 RepID=UPI0020BF5213|nr:hypothetical protein [Aliiroseovarius sp. S2029]MCK8484133.1 hypothetical protein [Aliiroseovarius sp. S2029]